MKEGPRFGRVVDPIDLKDSLSLEYIKQFVHRFMGMGWQDVLARFKYTDRKAGQIGNDEWIHKLLLHDMPAFLIDMGCFTQRHIATVLYHSCGWSE